MEGRGVRSATKKAGRQNIHTEKMDEEHMNPFDGIVEMMKHHHETTRKMSEASKNDKEKAEREIMMNLWGWLGNNTETYDEAFVGAHAYKKGLYAIREVILEMPHTIMVPVIRAFSAQMALDADMIEKMQKVADEMESSRPKPQ